MKDSSHAEVIVRDATEEDLPFMNEVYNYNILHSVGLFFTHPVSDEYRLNWFQSIRRKYLDGEPYPCLLGLSKGSDGKETKFGYVCYLPWMEGKQFQRAAQISLYLAQEHTGLGLGAELLSAILAHPSTKQLSGILAVITTENVRSVSFFSKRGFVYSGQLNNVGYKFERWLDVANYTLYPSGEPGFMSSQRGSNNSSTNLAAHDDALSTIVCRDIRIGDLSTVNDIHNQEKWYASVNSFVSTTTMEERRGWYERLGARPELPCPAILAQASDEVIGYAYLKPISDKPAYRFSAGLHLATHDQTASHHLLKAILSHPLTQRFRLVITTAAASEPFIQELSAQGFQQSLVWNRLLERNGILEDVLRYSIDLGAAELP
ncbi:hypothetical protein FRC12_003542 [Ceratobasidium sp. 428]|nr:hypothetical protein FRC09_005649 [Ceratobasidium sp. 395]KAG8771537.1 hypothetical protein FRC12_003542 [Ceratobasidium sp. 428]